LSYRYILNRHTSSCINPPALSLNYCSIVNINKGREISIIELPSVKQGSHYADGLEHAEFVIDVDFAEFEARYASITFDDRARNKSSNPDISIKLPSGFSVKFHRQPLDVVVAEEIAAAAAAAGSAPC
jgi:predicted metalloenzyme YecM